MFKYLTRYTHRVALSNDRLSGYDGERVTLSYKDYADGCRRKELRLSATELLRRFCLHIVPKGLVRIRHNGILTNRDHGQRLAKCRELLASACVAPQARHCHRRRRRACQRRRVTSPCLPLGRRITRETQRRRSRQADKPPRPRP